MKHIDLKQIQMRFCAFFQYYQQYFLIKYIQNKVNTVINILYVITFLRLDSVHF